MEGFTPVLSTIGGVLIGFAAIALLYFNGRIAGISGIMGGVLRPQNTLWRAVFLLGDTLVNGHPDALIFFTAMVTGMYAHRTVDQLAEIRTPTGSMSDG